MYLKIFIRFFQAITEIIEIKIPNIFIYYKIINLQKIHDTLYSVIKMNRKYKTIGIMYNNNTKYIL